MELRAHWFGFVWLLTLACAPQCLGGLINYVSYSVFASDVPNHTVIDFVSLPFGTIVTEQYTAEKVHFTDGNENITSSTSLVVDGKGLRGYTGAATDSMTIVFDLPVIAIGAAFPGALRIEVFKGVDRVGDSGQFGSSGAGFFGGIVSDTPFDRVVISDPTDHMVVIDNLYFTMLPETTGAMMLAVFSVGMLTRRKGA